jgi:hypothetical protein
MRSPKTLNIMANVKLLFYGTEESKTDETSIECFVNSNGDLSIFIEDSSDPATCVVLDKSTAIRFAKEIRKQIALMD